MLTIDIVYLILFFVCLAAAAFFCSAETAFIGIQKIRLHHLIQSKHPKAKAIAEVVAHPEKLLATVLLGINFFETAVATLGTLIAIRIWSENLGVAIATIVVTVLTLVFAEFIPKSLASRYGEKLAMLYIRPLQVISVPMFPFVWVLNHIGVTITGMASKSVVPKPTISEEEFHTAIMVGENEGVVEKAEAEMLHRVFEFTDRPVREIMTPRIEVVWVEKGSTLSEFLEKYRESPHSRFPVYEDTTDNVTGILFIKDVLLAEADGTLKADETIDRLSRDPYFVPETLPMGKLLADMKKTGNRMALVVDEFGGIAGGITLDQLLAEIVGEMGDELGEKEDDIVTIDANTFEVDGTLRIEEANEELSLGLPEGEYETVAGFVLAHLGRIPKQGENLKYKNLKISVHEMHGMKIDRLLITREQDAALKS